MCTVAPWWRIKPPKSFTNSWGHTHMVDNSSDDWTTNHH